MKITLFGESRDLLMVPWAYIGLGGVLAIFLVAFLWKILHAEEGFLFGYGNWVVGKWKGIRGSSLQGARDVPAVESRTQGPMESRNGYRTKTQGYEPARDRHGALQREHDLLVKADVMTLCRLLDGDLAYLMMNDADEWEIKIMRALQTIVSGVLRVVHPPGRLRSGFFILDDAEERLVLAAGEGYERVRRPSLALEHSCAGRAFQTGEDYYCRDIATDPSYWHSARGNRDFRSIACVPVRAGRAVFGVLCLDAQEPDAFTAEDFFHLEVLAAKIAVFCAFHTLQVTGVCAVRPERGD